MKQIQIFFLLLLGSTVFAALPSGPDMPCPFSATVTNYDDCAASCSGYYTACDIGACTRHCRTLFCTADQGDIQVCEMNYCSGIDESAQLDECLDVCLEQTEKWNCSGEGGTDDIPTDLCANVQCYDPYCDGNELVTCDCDEATGQCVCSAFWCAQGCDPATLQCIEKEINTKPAIIEVNADPGYVVLHDTLAENTLMLIVNAVNPDGSPAEGARVHVRLTDPKQTGVVGPWGFGDTVFYTDSIGSGFGELEFPTLRNIKEYHWDEFPYYVQMDVTVSKHDNSNDWSVTKSSQIELRTPAPRITEISINPDPAQSAGKHQVRVVVDDPDSTELTYVFTNVGGKWSTHAGALGGSTDQIYGFKSSSHNEVLEWEAPARGLTKDELAYAKDLLGNLDGTRVNLKFTMTEEIMKIYPKFILRLKWLNSDLAEKTASKFLWVAPGVNTAKSIYGLWGNTKNLAQDVDGLMKSVTWKEGLYKTIDLGFEGAKTTIGVLTLGGKEIPIIGGFASATQDLVDALVGTMQAKLNQLAALERIREAEALSDEMSVTITVRDSDGFYDKEYYSFQMEYLGFKPEEGG